ncbi:MAG TPA: SGNH/GDSL hydrolase family protein [Capillimicrobium sp.]|nr:SGNH/GDSL hydrolase family protein [Capillimicrobium sp.]
MTAIDTTGAWLEALDPDCLADADAAELLRDAPWQRMVVVGDSVAAGIREPLDGYRDVGFSDRVGEALARTRPGFAYRNLGVRDLKLAEIRERQLGPALAFAPDVAIVIGGGNDALGRAFDPGAVRAGLEALVHPLADRGAFVVTIGLFDLPRSGLLPERLAGVMTERFDALDAITAEVARSVGGLHVDTHHHPRAADPAIYASDRIHANARGHAIAFAAIVRALAMPPAWSTTPMT